MPAFAAVRLCTILFIHRSTEAAMQAAGPGAAAPLKNSSTGGLPGARSSASQTGVYTVDLNGDPELGYSVQLSLGTPETVFSVLVDTGSSNFAIAGYKDECIDRYFNSSRSSSFLSKGLEFTVRYTEGQWIGLLGSDAVRLATLPAVVANLSVISRSEKLFTCTSKWQGILGLAFQTISLPSGNVKPLFDELVSAGSVGDVFSLQLCPKASPDSSNTTASASGRAVFGGIDASLYAGAFHDVALTAKRYYEVIITDILVHNRSLGLDCREYNTKRTIVDSGTTNIMLPSMVYAELTSQLRNLMKLSASIPPGFWTGSEVACWPSGSYPAGLPTLTLRLLANGTHVVSLDLAPDQYLVKTTNGTRLPKRDCFKLAISVSGDVAIIGAQSMTAFYVRFDRAGQQVGFAKSTCPNGTATGSTQSRVSWYPNAGFSVASCAFDESAGRADRTSLTVIVACVVLVVVVSVLIAFIATRLRRQLALRGAADGNMTVQLVTDIDPDP